MSRMGRPVLTGADWMRDVERRLLATERRSMPSAASLLGPGFSASATQVSNWSEETALFNGMFFSLVGAVNTPDNTKAWIGWTLADGQGAGVQRVYRYREGITPVAYVRGFQTDTQTPAFTAWTAE